MAYYNASLVLDAAAFIVLGSWNAWENLENLRDRNPKIIINNKGIETVNTPFHPWSEITNDKVTLTGSGTKVASTKLSYDYPGGSEKLDIGSYDIRQNELERLLQIYRERSVTPQATNL